MTDVTVIIPFRDRGRDPLRHANLVRVLEHWRRFGQHIVVDDGRTGDAQFNRHAAYNRGAAQCDSDVIVYAEADMLIDFDQVREGIEYAKSDAGLVVPFTQYKSLTEYASAEVRAHRLEYADAPTQLLLDDSTGPINIVSRESLHAVGRWDETFDGNWYDDDAMQLAFEKTCGPTDYVLGPAYHLHHLPGWRGPHLTESDRAATQFNKQRYQLYRQARTPERIRELTSGAVE